MVLEWVLDRQLSGDAGVLVYIRVDDVDASLETISEAGGEIVLPRTDEGEGPAYATFRDPAGKRPRSLSRRRLAEARAGRPAGSSAQSLFRPASTFCCLPRTSSVRRSSANAASLCGAGTGRAGRARN